MIINNTTWFSKNRYKLEEVDGDILYFHINSETKEHALHRKIGPAIIAHTRVYLMWYKHNYHYRSDGPAYMANTIQWIIDGNSSYEDQYWNL